MTVFRKVLSILFFIALFGFSFCSLSAWGQETEGGPAGTIAGTVTDSTSGAALPGVNVTIAGTQQGAAAGANGQYRITGVEPGTYTLQASFVGYETKRLEGVQVAAGETTTADIAMRPGRVSLDNVVVTALGVEREERSLTYSAEQVNTEDIAKARELNVVSSLSGKVAGLSISDGGTGVGAPNKVLLRGNRSFNSSDDPLYVVDGVPVRGGISDLSPDIIENISVLKGPNAAALYGSAAQNGAIVVTTKRGEEGGIQVSMNNNFMFNTPNILTEYQNEYGQGSGGEYVPTTMSSWGARMEGQMVPNWSPDPEAPAEIAYAAAPDNVNDFFQTGYNASTNLTASIGNETTQGLISYTYSNSQGVVPNNALQRHNVDLRLTSELSDKVTVDGKLTYKKEDVDYRLTFTDGATTYMAYRIPRSISTAQVSDYEFVNGEGVLDQNTWNPGEGREQNPYWVANNTRLDTPDERVIGLGSLTYDFTEALSLMLRGAYDVRNDELEQLAYANTGDDRTGTYRVESSRASEFNGDFLLTYTEDFIDNWDFEVNVGGNIKQRRNNSLESNTGDGLIVPNFFTISNSLNPLTSYNPGGPSDIWSLYSFGQVSWNDAVFLDLTGRNDWSSTLPSENRSYFYPSAGLSAVLTDLVPALPDALSFARLRGSWAKVGSSAAPFQTVRFANFNPDGPGGRNGFLTISNELPAENLKPEETVSYEAGADVRFLSGRIGLDATVYQTNTRNQLFRVTLPVASGASSLYTNGGDVQNRGIEMLLRTTPVQSLGFNWDLNVNFSLNRNEVVRISDARESLVLGGPSSDFREFRVEEGEPFGQIYAKGYERDDQGRVIVGEDGVPEITPGLTVKVADVNPDWTGGITSTLSYKNFSLGFVIDHRQGGDVLDETATLTLGEGHAVETLKGRDGGLVFGETLFADETAVMQVGTDGEGNPIYEPNTIATDAETFWSSMGGILDAAGEPFVESATNTRLRELTLGYTLPQSVANYLSVSNLELTLVGRNLFFLYREADRVDPDILNGTGKGAVGLSSFALPTTRSFGANLSINF